MNQNSLKTDRFLTAFYLVFTVLAFSSIEIIANPIRKMVEPAMLTFWRFALGSLFLFPFLLFRDTKALLKLTSRDYIALFFLGALNIIFSMGAHAICMKYAKASTAAILIAANPIATNLFSWLILSEKMDKRRILALAMGFFGILLMVLKPDSATDTNLGIAAGIASMIGFGLYTVLSKKLVIKHGSLTVTVISCITALIGYIPMIILGNYQFFPPTESWGSLLALGIFGSGLGYITFFKALEVLPAGKTSYLFFFKPPTSIFLAWLILGEKVLWPAILGTALIMSGIFIETLRKKKTGQNAVS